jgi:hypothetical protein
MMAVIKRELGEKALSRIDVSLDNGFTMITRIEKAVRSAGIAMFRVCGVRSPITCTYDGHHCDCSAAATEKTKQSFPLLVFSHHDHSCLAP